MSTNKVFENNPFFKYDLDKLCIVCNRKLGEKFNACSVFHELKGIQPTIKVSEALKIISNFREINFHNEQPKICELCYNNTSSAIKFSQICNTSASFFESYQQHQGEKNNKLENEINDEMLDTPISSEFTTKTEELTITHEILSHDSDRQVTKTGIIKKKCKICNNFYRSEYMPSHLRIHTGEKPYSCTVCEKRFRHGTELKMHLLVHSGERNYLCTTCGKSFKTSSTFQTHTQSHTGERPHECEVCGKRFKIRATLREHYNTHSSEKPFACEVCGKCFPARKYLSQHMISHAEVKKHECHMCGNRFTQAHSLRTHVSKHCKGSS